MIYPYLHFLPHKRAYLLIKLKMIHHVLYSEWQIYLTFTIALLRLTCKPDRDK